MLIVVKMGSSLMIVRVELSTMSDCDTVVISGEDVCCGVVFASQVSTECGVFVMCCMQCCMAVSAVL